MTRVAPHLVRPLPFLLPLYDSGPYRPAVVQAGIAVYSTLARARLNGLVSAERAQRMVPDLRTGGLRRCGLYVDCVTNDSRLTLANVRAAAESGATVVNGAEVSALRVVGGRVRGADVVVDGENHCGIGEDGRQRRRAVGRRGPPARRRQGASRRSA